MSNTPPMYGELQPLDREIHKNLKLDTEQSIVGRIADHNSVFLAAVEFADACKEYPIVFVRVGNGAADNSKPAVAPLAVLGLRAGSNLFIEGEKWTGNYVPAYVRRYPFMMARLDNDANNLAVCYDAKWPGFNEATGEALFKDGEPTEFLLNAKAFLENFEQEAERTRLICNLLVELDLLQDMRFEATLPGGEKIDVEGFLALDDKKYAELPDAKVLELHRNGLIALIEMHRLSMTNMNRLVGKYAV
ncbi:MAG: SapC family protein [Comamonadaceae bacterium]|nr:SapC family protein [Comamonadaceae bacterium]